MLGKKYIFIDVEVPVDNLEEGVVYHCNNDRRIDLICPCGCQAIISLNTIPGGGYPCWKVIDHKTIHPSINRQVGCMSHFSITNNIVV